MAKYNSVAKSVDSRKERRSPKWRNKWWKAVTLYNNPSLRLDLLKQDLKNSKATAADKRVSMIVCMQLCVPGSKSLLLFQFEMFERATDVVATVGAVNLVSST